MASHYRVAVVGAASLRGKELADVLGESAFADAEFVLLDDKEATGQLESVGEEVTFIQPVTPGAFAHTDFAFFTGEPALTQRYWEAAVHSGSAVLDLSGALDDTPGTIVLAPWLEHSVAGLELQTTAVVPAHPLALMLGLLMGQVRVATSVRSAFATILEPASEYGRAAMDELHQQTVNLLSFQPLPKTLYGAQVAFNAMAAVGSDGKIDLAASEARVRHHYALLSGGRLPSVAIQLVHAPLFHAHTLSLGIEVERAMTADQLRQLLGASEHIDVATTDDDMPSNLAAAGQDQVLVRVRAAEDETTATTRFWLWAAADNLKLTAVNAVACALEMRRLRPHGQVQ